MTNEEYSTEIELRIKELIELKTNGKNIVVRIVGDSLSYESIFFLSSVNRYMHLIDGFVEMLKKRNLTCAGALLRLQLDNCMRVYATFIAEDEKSVVECIVSGKRIDKLKSRDGKNLSDANLKKELNKIDSRFTNVYNNVSGYIHFSSKAFYQTISNLDESSFEMNIGSTLPERFNKVLVELLDAYIYYADFYNNMLSIIAGGE